MTSENGIKLTPLEVVALASAMVAERLADCGAWAHWELVPLIDEDSYRAVLILIESIHSDEESRAAGMRGRDLMAMYQDATEVADVRGLAQKSSVMNNQQTTGEMK